MFFFGILAAIEFVAFIACPLLFILSVVWLGSTDFKKLGYYEHNFQIEKRVTSGMLFLVLGLIGLHTFGVVDIIHLAINMGWKDPLVALGCYLTLSVPYTKFFSWKKIVKRIYEIRNEEIQSIRKMFAPSDTVSIQERIVLLKLDQPIQIKDYKAMIVRLMTFWPLVLINNLVVDYLLNFWRTIFDMVAKSFQRDSDRMFKEQQEETKV